MKAVCLLSGGIDSPVAAYLMSQRGVEVILLHMEMADCDDSLRQKCVRMADQLRKATGRELPLYSAPHGIAQNIIKERKDTLYTCVLCKHVMQLAAKELCRKLGASAIIMGDSLGQVASQTLMNIKTTAWGLDFPVIRPLIGYDKLEIIDIAERIGTYGISTSPSAGCAIVPPRVVTESDLKKAQEYYEEIDAVKLAERIATEAVRLS